MYNEQVYIDEWYMKIYERITKPDKTESYYTRMMGNPSSMIQIPRSNYKDIKEYVHNIMKNIVHHVEHYTITVNESGFTYERYIKWIDEEKGECITGTPSDFDDYEEFTIDMYYVTCQMDAFKQLMNA